MGDRAAGRPAAGGGPRVTAEAATPLLILDAVERFLDDHRLGHGAVTATRIGDGNSNVTYLLERGGRRFVLRRPPRPPYPASAHDMVREAALQQALAAQGVRVPAILAVADDLGLLGVPFYVSEYLEGHVMTDALPPMLERDEASRGQAMDDVVRALADIHAVDVTAPAVAAFVRPGSYVERQIRRFRGLWEANATRAIPELGELGGWLERTAPAAGERTVIHGDYRVGNVMLSADPSARVVAVLDWEMGTIGDPRADLGYFIATYSHAGSRGTPLELTPVTSSPGFPSPEALVERYVELTGRDVAGLAWFQAFGLWKGAIFCEAIYGRHLRGELEGNRFAASLETGVPELARAAAAVAEAA
jgi:aminoglycoside phosphotransferase (APT) family kinase protein